MGGRVALADSVLGFGAASGAGGGTAFFGLAEVVFAFGAAALRGFEGVFAVAMLVPPACFFRIGSQPAAHGLSLAAIIA
ncbi:hypothetical protein DBR21_17775 [Caulobacter sp. HMWF009]|nr:hypothetical protein DBR21_17775 [Caulobacter sp. HMWF009]